MRDILFRGRDRNGEWRYGSLLVYPDRDCSICTCDGEETDVLIQSAVDPDTVRQYTGLTDKNGAKIFEGDCVQDFFSNSIGVIRYGEYRQPFNDDDFTGHIGFYVDWISGKSKDMFRKDLGYWINHGEIIGNIHDNLELLKRGADDVRSDPD